MKKKKKKKTKIILSSNTLLADNKYKNLEERLAAMEVQRVPGLDFEELGLVAGIVIPPKFKVPTFAKYDGLSCPKMHLRSYSERSNLTLLIRICGSTFFKIVCRVHN